jgi:hypothetical protein
MGPTVTVMKCLTTIKMSWTMMIGGYVKQSGSELTYLILSQHVRCAILMFGRALPTNAKHASAHIDAFRSCDRCLIRIKELSRAFESRVDCLHQLVLCYKI